MLRPAFLNLKADIPPKDIEALVTEFVNTACSDKPSALDHRAWIWHQIMTEADRQAPWSDTYGRSHCLDLGGVPWKDKCAAAGLTEEATQATLIVVEVRFFFSLIWRLFSSCRGCRCSLNLER